MLRVISEIRPAFVVAENVRGAVNLALDTVYSGLVGEGYKVYPYVIPASAVGAPHQRERLFVFGVRSDVADTYAERLQGRQEPGSIYAMRKKSSYEQSGRSGEGGGKLWPTPTSTERSGINPNTGSGAGLTHAVSLWRTPDANCMRGPSSEERMVWKREKGMPISINDQVGKGSLNPAWVECLMGFPLGWTDIDCDEPEPWPGWPAMMGERLWMTPKAGACGMTAKTKGRPLEMATHLSTQTFVAERDFVDQHPYEPPRTVTGCLNRAKRLKCLGNAVVPAQARPFFEAIRQIHNLTTCECFT